MVHAKHLSSRQLNGITRLHLSALSESVLCVFGKHLIRVFYLTAASCPSTVLLVLEKNRRVIGFALGLINPGMFNRYLFKTAFIKLLLAGLPTALKKPLWTVMFLLQLILSPTELRQPQLLFIAVAPAYRGAGLGRKLIAGLSDTFSAHRIRRFVVGTSSSNQLSNKFYWGLGFKPIGPRRVFGILQNFYLAYLNKTPA